MRTALLMSASLMMIAAAAWADEPNAPSAKVEAAAAAETTPAKPTEEAAASDATTAAIADEDKKLPFKPPAGYKPKRINGEQVWCAKVVVLGTRFPQQDCRNEAELRELIRTREAMRTDMEMRTKTCTSASGCGLR